jgi:hypothetical protein
LPYFKKLSDESAWNYKYSKYRNQIEHLIRALSPDLMTKQQSLYHLTFFCKYLQPH